VTTCSVILLPWGLNPALPVTQLKTLERGEKSRPEVYAESPKVQRAEGE